SSCFILLHPASSCFRWLLRGCKDMFPVKLDRLALARERQLKRKIGGQQDSSNGNGNSAGDEADKEAKKSHAELPTSESDESHLWSRMAQVLAHNDPIKRRSGLAKLRQYMATKESWTRLDLLKVGFGALAFSWHVFDG